MNLRAYKTSIAALALCFPLMGGCERIFMDSDPDDFSRREIFDAVWKTVDEKYSFLELKGIDWDAAYQKYSQKVTEDMEGYYLCETLSDMLYELEDGHVNMSVGFNYSRYWKWYLDAPANFDYSVVERNYLREDYWASGGLKNSLLDGGEYGYIYYESFNASPSYIGLILDRFAQTDGIILDLRDNGGGALDNAEYLADFLADTRRLTYRMRYKNGPGHGDFTPYQDHYSTPKGPGYKKPIVVLTNRKCYSATSFFVTMVKEFPNVIVLGDSTGGGAGLPMDCVLPGGWTLRLSTSQGADARGVCFERGVDPDERCTLDVNLSRNGIDSIIERAKEIIDAASTAQDP